MGSLAETERAQIVNDLHEMGDKFLNERLNTVAQNKPELLKELEQLRLNNRDLSAAVRIKEVAEKADAAEFRKRSKLPERISMLAAGTLGTAAAVVGGSAGGFIPAAIAGTAGLTAGAAAQKLSRAQTEILGRMARSAKGKDGKAAVAKLAQEAIAMGVPQRTVRAVQVSVIKDDDTQQRRSGNEY